MRIISLNAWGGAMFDALSAWLPTCGADVLCLQEVTNTPGLGGWTRFEDAERQLPQRASLLRDVADALPHHHVTFVASDSGPVQDEAGTTHRQDFGLAVAVHERLSVIGHHAAFVHGTYTAHDEWPAGGRPRVAQAIRVADHETGRTHTIAHLHGLRDPAGKGDSAERRAQAEQFARLIDSVREADDHVLACGDFNILPDSTTFEVLARSGLTDLVGDADTRTSRYTKPVRHANYLLVSDPAAVRDFSAPAHPEVSDHRFLQLEL